MPEFPKYHFPGTPSWVREAVSEAIARVGVNAGKWTVPLEAIAFYESSYSPAANLCKEDKALPVGMFQQGRSFYKAALVEYPEEHRGLGWFDDPVRSCVMAILHINSQLSVSGGYQGIGTLTSKNGLLSLDSRGPRGVLREWIKLGDDFVPEDHRTLYKGY